MRWGEKKRSLESKSKATDAESTGERYAEERAWPQPVKEKSRDCEMRFGVTLLQHIAAA